MYATDGAIPAYRSGLCWVGWQACCIRARRRKCEQEKSPGLRGKPLRVREGSTRDELILWWLVATKWPLIVGGMMAARLLGKRSPRDAGSSWVCGLSLLICDQEAIAFYFNSVNER